MSLNSKSQVILSLVWFGVVLGISFLEAPVKFTTPSLTREVALDVGQTVFQALNYFEWVMAVLLGSLIILSKKSTLDISSPVLPSILFGVVFTLLFTQSFWLLPELKSRAATIISGVEPPKSYIHLVYILMDLIKLSILLIIGFKKLPSN